MFKKIKINQLREFTSLRKNKNGDLTTELIRPCTNFISAKTKVHDIIFSKRCRIIKPDKLVELTMAYCENEIVRKESLSIYISEDKATVNFTSKKSNNKFD